MSAARGISDSVPAAPPDVVRRYGYLDVQTHQAHRQVSGEDLLPYLDGRLMEHVSATHDLEGWLELFVWSDAHYRDVVAPLLAAGKAWYVGERKVRCIGEVRMVPK